ncbi:MAG TPA: hypothetical protein ENK62_02215 [Chromatiales bacterium]|nr:hypothetical protein [Chromatiales bacterium]
MPETLHGRALLGLVLALLVSACGRADPDPHPPNAPTADLERRYQQARDASHRGDYAVAYCILRELAEQYDDPRAAFLLGWMYHNGYGLAIDDEQAIAWWTKAARHGHADAWYALGQLMELDTKDKARKAKALDYYLEAARLGHEDAQQWLRHRLARLKPDPRLLDALQKEWRVFGPTRKIKARAANLRAKPSTKAKRLRTLPKGTPVVVIGALGRKWRKVGVPGTRLTGWVYAPLLD